MYQSIIQSLKNQISEAQSTYDARGDNTDLYGEVQKKSIDIHRGVLAEIEKSQTQFDAADTAQAMAAQVPAEVARVIIEQVAGTDITSLDVECAVIHRHLAETIAGRKDSAIAAATSQMDAKQKISYLRAELDRATRSKHAPPLVKDKGIGKGA